MIEVLVVLVVLAGLLAIAFPQFAKLYARVRMSFERSDLERQLLELPQHVREAGRGGILLDPSAYRRSTAIAEASPGGGNDFEDWQVLRLDLPEGWSMRVPKPVIYHFTGACDGGEVSFSLPPLSLRYVLTAPLCRPLPADAT